MKKFRILQNQDKFSTEEYKQYVTPLVDMLKKSRFSNSLRKLRRNGFIAGLLMYLYATDFDVIVTVGHRTAMVYGLLSRLYNQKGKIQVAKEFYFEKNAGLSVKKFVLKPIYLFSYKNLKAVIINSSREKKVYAKGMRLPESIFHFIPWPSSINNPKVIEHHENYIFAVGRSLRDWKTFFFCHTWVKRKICCCGN